MPFLTRAANPAAEGKSLVEQNQGLMLSILVGSR